MRKSEFVPPKEGEVIAIAKFRSITLVSIEDFLQSLFEKTNWQVFFLFSVSFLLYVYQKDILFCGKSVFDYSGIILLSYVVLYILRQYISNWFYQLSNSRAIENLRVVYFGDYLVVTDKRFHFSKEYAEKFIHSGTVKSVKVNITLEASLYLFKSQERVNWEFVFEHSDEYALKGDWKRKSKGEIHDVVFQSHPKFKGYTKSNQLIQFIRSQGDVAIFWIP